MANYSVHITKVPLLEIGNSDMIFQIKRDRKKLGSLKISEGEIVWTPTNKQISYCMDWSKFDKVAEEKDEPGKVSY